MIKCNDDFAKRDGMRVGVRIVAVAIALVLAVGCLAGAPVRASAATTSAGTDGNGTIDVSYRNDDEPVAGVHLSIYRVGQWRASGGYEPTKAFSGYSDTIDWSGLLNADDETFRVTAQTLSAYAQRDGIAADSRTTTDANGDAAFDGLANGLYLVSAARYEGISAMGANIVCGASALFVALPTNEGVSGETGDADGGRRSMHATLSPKTECETNPQPGTVDIIAHKVWKNDVSRSGVSADRPDSVTVQLLRDGVVADTVRLHAGNRWRHRWTGLDSGHDWRVVEAQVPSRYLVALDREGAETVITNTHVASPETGSSIVHIAVLAAVIAVAAIGLLTCMLSVRRRRRT